MSRKRPPIYRLIAKNLSKRTNRVNGFVTTRYVNFVFGTLHGIPKNQRMEHLKYLKEEGYIKKIRPNGIWINKFVYHDKRG